MSGPWINPGAIITSPFLAGTRRFDILRRAETIGTNGRAQIVETWIYSQQGIIAPVGGAAQREPAFQTQGKGITVATRVRLYGVARDGYEQPFQPDRIRWRGDMYQVVNLTDATEIGGGWVLATCQSVDLLDLAPQP